MTFPILSLMLLVPLLGAIACMFAQAPAARLIALAATLANLALGVRALGELRYRRRAVAVCRKGPVVRRL